MEAATRIDAFFLTCTPKEFKAIKGFLEENEYTPDSDGLKECLLDFMDQERQPRPGEVAGSMVADFVKNNPELIRAGLGGVAGIAGKVLRSGFKRR